MLCRKAMTFGVGGIKLDGTPVTSANRYRAISVSWPKTPEGIWALSGQWPAGNEGGWARHLCLGDWMMLLAFTGAGSGPGRDSEQRQKALSGE